MQTTLIDPAELSRLVLFFDVLAAVVFAVSGVQGLGRSGNGHQGQTERDPITSIPLRDARALEERTPGLGAGMTRDDC